MTTYTHFLRLPDEFWTQQGGERNAGEGIVIGFIDSGITPYHPSFAYEPDDALFTLNVGRFPCACEAGPLFPARVCNGKIISARFFAAGAQAAATLNASIDFLSPFDAVGHGRIAVYKAIYPSIGTLADVVSAVDQGILDGVDILTLSIGPDKPPEDTLTFLSVFEIAMLLGGRAGVIKAHFLPLSSPLALWLLMLLLETLTGLIRALLFLEMDQLLDETHFNTSWSWPKRKLELLGHFKDPGVYRGVAIREAFDPAIVQACIVISTFSSGFFNGTSSVATIINTANVLGFMGFMLLAKPTSCDFISEPIPLPVPGIMIPRVADSQQTRRDPSGLVTTSGRRTAIGEGRVASFTVKAPVLSRFSSRGPDITDSYRTKQMY
ncbi:hypothetical protein RJ641_018542 [Dillenia turbinata]|uniref:Peptidase S8/S53 domain-containing protein n=1 Tax=Dillenia turbinata TaxID=194707 RepID=A0AAN8YYH9_9MAGN